MTFFQVEELLGQLVARHGWQPVSEDGRLIAAQRGQASVTLEPGGQLELSGAPQPNLHAFHAELSNHIAEVTSIGREMGVEILGLGLDPLSREDPAEGGVSTMPKATFRVFAKHYAADKPREQLMYLTCTTQVGGRVHVSFCLPHLATARGAHAVSVRFAALLLLGAAPLFNTPCAM